MRVTLVFRPSAIISSTAPTPSAVAGIFTMTLSSAKVVCGHDELPRWSHQCRVRGRGRLRTGDETVGPGRTCVHGAEGACR